MPTVSLKLDRFAVCQIHGTTDIVIEHNTGDGIRKYEKSFPSEKDAIFFVNHEKEAFIRQRLENFVKHKKIIFDTSNNDFYKNSDKLNSLDIAWRCVNWIQDKDLKLICPNIIKIRHHLFNILPIDTNPSYCNSEEELKDILRFCQENT